MQMCTATAPIGMDQRLGDMAELLLKRSALCDTWHQAINRIPSDPRVSTTFACVDPKADSGPAYAPISASRSELRDNLAADGCRVVDGGWLENPIGRFSGSANFLVKPPRLAR